MNLMDHLAAGAMAAIERADLLAQLEALARTDELTGLPNRRAINEDLPRELERARREERSLCLALLDLDHFKRFNDTNGHPAGDRMLQAAAAAWRQQLRSGTDLLARYGGEEFLIVLPASIEEATDTMERLRASTPDPQTVSVGLARWDGDETPEELVARADAALYAAKEAGRDRIVQASTIGIAP
jgi:diguanylate cyclase (GGDEF)-like protein